jgi:signal transduction histidine kinase
MTDTAAQAPATTAELHELLARSIGPACHELRGPLAAAYGFGRMLQTSDALPESLARYADQVVRGCERLDGMLDSLSTMGRVAAGRVTPDRTHVSVVAAVREAAADGRHADAVTLTSAPGEDVVADVDRAWLLRALGGIFDALRYNDDIRVSVAVSHRPHAVILAVRTHSDLPDVDTAVGAAALSIACARVQIATMAGSLASVDGGVDLTLPRP